MDRAERWKRRIEQSRHGFWMIGVASFLESIIVPIPLEVVLIPYMLARRDRIWWIATITTGACLLGALVGYGVGYFVFETAGRWLVETFGWSGALERFRSMFQQHGFLAVLGIGVLPIPFQVAMLAAGAAKYPLYLFVLAAGIARGIRYFGLALLVVAFGARAERLWDEHATAVGVAALLVCAGAVTTSLLL